MFKGPVVCIELNTKEFLSNWLKQRNYIKEMRGKWYEVEITLGFHSHNPHICFLLKVEITGWLFLDIHVCYLILTQFSGI